MEDTRRILYAEDDDAVRTVTEMLIKFKLKGKHEFASVTNGTDLDYRAKEGNWDLIVTDMNMPGMNGYEALKAIRGRGDNTYAIVCSAQPSTSPLEQKALALGNVSHIWKGKNALDLPNAINRMFWEVPGTGDGSYSPQA